MASTPLVTRERLTHTLGLLIAEVNARTGRKRSRTWDTCVHPVEFPCVHLPNMRIQMRVSVTEGYTGPEGVRPALCSMYVQTWGVASPTVRLRVHTTPYTLWLEPTSEDPADSPSEDSDYCWIIDPECAPFRRYMYHRGETDLYGGLRVKVAGPEDVDTLLHTIEEVQHLRYCSELGCMRVFVSRTGGDRCPTCVLLKGPPRPPKLDATTADEATCSVCLSTMAYYACNSCTAVLHPECFTAMASTSASSCPQCRTGQMRLRDPTKPPPRDA